MSLIDNLRPTAPLSDTYAIMVLGETLDLALDEVNGYLTPVDKAKEIGTYAEIVEQFVTRHILNPGETLDAWQALSTNADFKKVLENSDLVYDLIDQTRFNPAVQPNK